MSTSKKRMAGKNSGVRRAKLATLRRFLVLAAFERLKPTYQMQPFSDEAIDALEEEFRRPTKRSSDLNLDLPLDEDEVIVPSRLRSPSGKLTSLLDEAVSVALEGTSDVRSPFKASRETLIKDLKALGIRSNRRRQRSG